MRVMDAAALSGFVRKTAKSASDFASVVHNLIMDVRQLPARVAPHAWPRPEMAGQASPLAKNSILKPYLRPGSTSCSRCTYAVATRLTPSDSQADVTEIMLMVGVLLFAVSLSMDLATISRAETSVCNRISDLASARARWAAIRGWKLLFGATLCIALAARLRGSAHAGVALEERKLPMKFSLIACQVWLPTDARRRRGQTQCH